MPSGRRSRRSFYAERTARFVPPSRAPFVVNTCSLIRIVQVAVVAVLVGYLGAHHHRFQRELDARRMAACVPRQPPELAAELVSECSEVLEAPEC